MSPTDLGLPESFDAYRPAQMEAIDFCLTSDKRFVGLGLPTGSGKSLIGPSLAKLLGGRTIILTANLGLERQYLDELSSAGLVGIRGRSNYTCAGLRGHPSCADGPLAGCKDKFGCPYLIEFGVAQQSEIVVCNYAYWLAVHEKANGMKPFDLMICDEAGLADSWLSRALDYEITERELHAIGWRGALFGEDHAEWIAHSGLLLDGAMAFHQRAAIRVEQSRPRVDDRLRREFRRAEALLDGIKKIAQLDANWIISKEEGRDDGRAWKFECIWPGRYRETLFRWVPRVVLMSGTLRPKTMQLLGIARGEYEFKEWPRQFPAANAPVIWVPTVRVNHRIDEEKERIWIERIREIVSARSDRRGIIHTVSYARARKIADEIGSIVYLNGAADPNTQTAKECFDRFIRSPAGSVLCSPSFATGWDFAGKRAEYQIIAKLPLPDSRSRIMQARIESDPGYIDYLAAQELVQACGRVQRYPKDRGETLLIDDSIGWFYPKAKAHMPHWWRYRREDKLPPPLELLAP